MTLEVTPPKIKGNYRWELRVYRASIRLLKGI